MALPSAGELLAEWGRGIDRRPLLFTSTLHLSLGSIDTTGHEGQATKSSVSGTGRYWVPISVTV